MANGLGSLNIFDIDDTLYKSLALIRVLNDGKIVKKLSPGEFNTYKLKTGEVFDFSEFRSADIFYKTGKPIKAMIAKARMIVKNQGPMSKTILLTARSNFDDKNLFLKRFRDNGFPIDQVYVERGGNISEKYGLSVEAAKAKILDKYLMTGKFNKVRMWDDHAGNLDKILELNKKYPNVTIEAYRVVSDSGNTTRYR